MAERSGAGLTDARGAPPRTSPDRCLGGAQRSEARRRDSFRNDRARRE